MTRKVLVTGGKGKTGRRLAARLAASGVAYGIGTRSPEGAKEVRFDWADRSSASAFNGCDAVYLVAPTDRTDHLAVMKPLLQEAIDRGVRRFVLLSSSLLEPGGPMMGAVHDWLARNTSDWAVLRPSWFMQNFSEGPHAATIREEGTLYTATGTGRVGFIDAGDIAEAARAILTAATPLNADVVLTGPEALSYDDAAVILSTVIGRTVRHVSMDPDDLTLRLLAQGLSSDYAGLLTGLDTDIARGVEDRTTSGFSEVTGLAPTTLRTFANRVAHIWQ